MSADHVYYRPVLPLLFCLIVGLIIGCYLPSHPLPVVLLLATAGFWLCRCLKQKTDVVFSPLFFFCALGYLVIQPWAAPVLSEQHVARYTDSQILNITGTIVARPVKTVNRLRFILALESLGTPETIGAVKGKIAVSAWGEEPVLNPGDRVSFSARIKSIHNYNNPGRFDYRRHMHFKNIWATAHVSADRLTVLERRTSIGGRIFVDNARRKLSRLIEKTAAGDQKEVLKALVIGERQDISPKGREAFNRAGVGHLLAISGLHIGIIATVAFAVFRRLLARSRFFLRRAWTRKGAALLSVFPVLYYGLLAGMSPSTQRAVIMVAVFLLSFLLEKEQDPINTLGLAAAVILTCHPPAFFSISFQLSFGAVFAIIYGLEKTGFRHMPPPGTSRAGHHMVSFLLVSAFAVLGTLPLVMRYFNQVSLIGLFANLMLIPLIGFMVVPLGLLAAILLPFGADVAFGLMGSASFLLSKALDLIHFFADLPFAAVRTFTPSIFEVACYYLFFASLLLLLNAPKTPAVEHQRLKKGGIGSFSRRKKAAVMLAAALICFAADAAFWIYERYWRKDLRMTVIDVGQGAACLLEIPGGHTMLVDGGGLSDNSTFDMGARVIAPLLWHKKIRTIDTMVLSHANSDHLNGLLYIARQFKVKQIWSNSQPADTHSFRRFVETVKRLDIPSPGYRDLARTHKINSVTVALLYPPKEYLTRIKTGPWRNLNNNSLVLQVVLGAIRILLPADIMADAERELVAASGIALKSNVLLVPHHGSRHSSTDLFVEAVQPEVAILSSGRGNRFNFPHPAVLKKYQNCGSRIFRTDRDGAVMITTDGRRLSITSFLPPLKVNPTD